MAYRVRIADRGPLILTADSACRARCDMARRTSRAPRRAAGRKATSRAPAAMRADARRCLSHVRAGRHRGHLREDRRRIARRACRARRRIRPASRRCTVLPPAARRIIGAGVIGAVDVDREIGVGDADHGERERVRTRGRVFRVLQRARDDDGTRGERRGERHLDGQRRIGPWLAGRKFLARADDVRTDEFFSHVGFSIVLSMWREARARQ